MHYTPWSMRISLTKEADYATRAVFDLARHHTDLRTTVQITAAINLARNRELLDKGKHFQSQIGDWPWR